MAVIIKQNHPVGLNTISEGDTFMLKGEVWVKTSLHNPYVEYSEWVMCIKLGGSFCPDSHMSYFEPSTLVIPVKIIDIVVEQK